MYILLKNLEKDIQSNSFNASNKFIQMILKPKSNNGLLNEISVLI